jgi:hypothetical protein
MISTGFQVIDNQLWISKDPEAKLFYTFDWSDWLASDDYITDAEYSLQVRVNDPRPLIKESSGLNSTRKTFVELSRGQAGKSYVVSVKITTNNGLIDRRSFKIKVEDRSAA